MASRFLSGSTTTVVHSKREQINEGTPGPSSYLIYSSQAQEGPLISEKKSIPRMRSKSWGSYRDTSLRLGEPDAERSNTVAWNSWALNPQGTSKLCRFCKAVRPSGPAKCSHFWLESPIHDWTTSSTIRSSSIWQLLFLAIACISNSGVLGMTGEERWCKCAGDGEWRFIRLQDWGEEWQRDEDKVWSLQSDSLLSSSATCSSSVPISYHSLSDGFFFCFD